MNGNIGEKTVKDKDQLTHRHSRTPDNANKDLANITPEMESHHNPFGG